MGDLHAETAWKTSMSHLLNIPCFSVALMREKTQATTKAKSRARSTAIARSMLRQKLRNIASCIPVLIIPIAAAGCAQHCRQRWKKMEWNWNGIRYDFEDWLKANNYITDKQRVLLKLKYG